MALEQLVAATVAHSDVAHSDSMRAAVQNKNKTRKPTKRPTPNKSREKKEKNEGKKGGRAITGAGRRRPHASHTLCRGFYPSFLLHPACVPRHLKLVVRQLTDQALRNTQDTVLDIN